MEGSMEVLRVIKGTDRTVRVSLRTSNGAPYDLSSALTIKALFQKQGDSENLLELTLAADEIEIVGDASRGQVDVIIDSANSENLRAGERLTWELEITTPATTHVARFPESLDVIERLAAT
jgi:hypothetical protein